MASARLSFVAVGNTASVFLAVTYTLCVFFDLLFPRYAMYPAWQRLLPGFEWIGWGSYFLGLVETYVYGWYAAALWVPLYHFFSARAEY